MFANYFHIAFRNLRRQKGYAAINIVGLAVGLACFLLVAMYLRYAYTFDDYHEKSDRLYRIVSYGGFGEKQWGAWVAGDPVPEMRASDTAVEDATKYMHCGSSFVKMGDEVFRDVQMQCAEPNLFNIFSFDLVRGDPASLSRPDAAVITRSLAERLFGDDDPVGQTIPVFYDEEERLFEVTGLMEDVPGNTHFTFDLLLPYVSLETTNRCTTCGQPMYALLKPGADPEEVAARVLTHIREVDGRDYVEDIRLEPVRDIYFSDIGAARQGDRRYVYLLSGIALVLLLIACANYVNLATARSIRRAREVGVRKAVGAHRGQLVRQFLVETLLLTLLALPIGYGLLVFALPTFNTLAETDISLAMGGSLGLAGFAAGMVLVIGLLAGAYPAFFLSRFRPIEVLRGRTPGGYGGVALRRVLVVFQFAASIALIIATFVILRQLDFMQGQKLGFDTEQVVLVSVTDPVLAQKPDVVKESFLRVPGVLAATAGSGVPGQRGFSGARFIDRPFGEDGPAVIAAAPSVDADFLEVMDIPLLAGRNIAAAVSEEGPMEALVNEAAVRAMQWGTPEEALGETLMGEVVGVVLDFHFESLHQEIAPLAMQQNRWGRAYTVALRLAPGDVAATFDGLERAWESTGTALPFEVSFLTDELTELYENEQQTAQVFGLFAALAVFIACLGLLGLASFMAVQRTKEIGIRKVLGATVGHIVVLLSKDFTVLVAVAFVLAAPLAYYAMQGWLEDFAYRIEIGWVPLVLAGGAALAIALGTVSWQAIRAALTDPVDALRHE